MWLTLVTRPPGGGYWAEAPFGQAESPSIRTEVRAEGKLAPAGLRVPCLSFEARGGGVKSRCELKGRREAQASHLVGGRGYHLNADATRLGEGAGGSRKDGVGLGLAYSIMAQYIGLDPMSR